MIHTVGTVMSKQSGSKYFWKSLYANLFKNILIRSIDPTYSGFLNVFYMG